MNTFHLCSGLLSLNVIFDTLVFVFPRTKGMGSHGPRKDMEPGPVKNLDRA